MPAVAAAEVVVAAVAVAAEFAADFSDDVAGAIRRHHCCLHNQAQFSPDAFSSPSFFQARPSTATA
jgi:hypothetical protein